MLEIEGEVGLNPDKDKCIEFNMVAEQRLLCGRGSSAQTDLANGETDLANGFYVQDPDTGAKWFPNVARDEEMTVDLGSSRDGQFDWICDNKALLETILGKIESLSEAIKRIENQLQEKPKQKDKCPTGVWNNNKDGYDVGVDRLRTQKLETEEAQKESDLYITLSLDEAASSRTMVEGVVDKWFVDKGFGFIKVRDQTVFCHASAVVGRDCLKNGSKVWIRVVLDEARSEDSWKAKEAWPEEEWKKEKMKRMAKEAVVVAERAAKVVVRSVEKGRKMMDELEDLSFRTEAGFSSLAADVKLENGCQSTTAVAPVVNGSVPSVVPCLNGFHSPAKDSNNPGENGSGPPLVQGPKGTVATLVPGPMGWIAPPVQCPSGSLASPLQCPSGPFAPSVFNGFGKGSKGLNRQQRRKQDQLGQQAKAAEEAKRIQELQEQSKGVDKD